MSESPAFDSPFEQYWDWIAVALFLLTTVDMITTIYAAHLYGSAAEVNPIMRWILGQGLGVLVLVNLVAVIVVVALFYAVQLEVRRMPSPHDRAFALIVEVWVGLLIAIGLGIFANNLTAIVHGASLI